MMSPFDTKNRVASALDSLAVRLLLFAGCVGYFFFLWHHGAGSLLAGGALFLLVLLTFFLLEKRTLSVRERALRERVGGAIALEELLIMPAAQASASVCKLLCLALHAESLSGAKMRYAGKVWLVRCVQCLPGSCCGEGDVLSAHRARIEQDAEACVLVSLGGLSPAAQRAGEWLDPPIRLISGRQLALLAGRVHPATDSEMARRARRQRTPFSWSRIQALALAPGKQNRYLLCAFLLTLFYLLFEAVWPLLFGLVSFALALLCARENRYLF